MVRKRKSRKSSKVQKVQIVRKRSRKRGPRLNALLKPKLMVKMQYCDTISLNPGAAAITSHVFRAGSIFDPDLTGTGQLFIILDCARHYTG